MRRALKQLARSTRGMGAAAPAARSPPHIRVGSRAPQWPSPSTFHGSTSATGEGTGTAHASAVKCHRPGPRHPPATPMRGGHGLGFVSVASSCTCRSVDGDSQGLELLLGELSAHMWPGIILKSGNRITAPFLVEKQESKYDEFNYENLEYEVLSHGFDDQWKFVSETSTSRRFERSNEADSAQNHTHQVVKASIDSSTSNPLPNNTPIETTEENN
ncbi:GTP binding, partial [Zea mays]